MFEADEKKNIVLGITGSIAAYKSAELARMLVSWGYEVRVVMTKAATEFVAPLTFATLTGNPVVTDFWAEAENMDKIGHIQLADWADLLLIAPASADIIAKIKGGFCDEVLSAICLATKAPIQLAPAMNVNMYEHPVTQSNLAALKERGVSVIEPEVGDLACGWKGSGRLAEPWEIFHAARRQLSRRDFLNKNVLITTGPTREAIDPVRFISNRSSGKMGVSLAREAYRRGAKVTLVHGPAHIRVPKPIDRVSVTTAEEMREKVLSLTFGTDPGPDIVIMAAAVCDYRVKNPTETKIKKRNNVPQFVMELNPDILAEIGARRGNGTRPVLVGFAVETGEIEDLIQEARRKLEEKNADLIVGNFATDAFELDTNRAWLVDKNGKEEEISTTYKSRVANKILDMVSKF